MNLTLCVPQTLLTRKHKMLSLGNLDVCLFFTVEVKREFKLKWQSSA